MASNDDYDKEGMLVSRSYRVPEYARPDYDPTSSEAIKKYLGERVSAPRLSPAGRWWQRHGILPEILRGDAPRTVSSEEQAFRNRVLADALALAEQKKKTQQDYQRLAETSAELRDMPRVTGSTYFEPMSDEELARRQQEDVERAQAIINRRYPTAPAEGAVATAGGSSAVTPEARSILRQKLNIPTAELQTTSTPAVTTATPAAATATPEALPPAPSRTGLPLMARPNSGVMPAPNNIGSSFLRFGMPDASGKSFDAGYMPAQLSGSDYTRFSMDAPPAVSRPAARPTPPAPLAPPADLRRSEPTSFLSRLFSGPEYQSTGERVVKKGGQGVNFGSPESAADFFRADKALRAQRPEMFERQAEARGGATKSSGGGGKDAALHKALEIIHHMLVRGR
jgi:hypothetical protein